MIDPFGFALGRAQRRAVRAPHPEHPGWPETTDHVETPDGTTVRLRPLLRRDAGAWSAMRNEDVDALRPVEPTVAGNWERAHDRSAWWQLLLTLHNTANAGGVVPMAIECDGRFAGQLTLGNIQHGVVSDCWIGYWVSSRYTGRGVATAAVALGTDHAFTRVGVHRVTATYLPANPASGRVLAINGFREEGYLVRCLHIDGDWRDHHLVALTEGEFLDSCVDRLRNSGRLLRRDH
ncbi:GNAT family N-acetyltransferase [Corynebacterium pygosceleis]|uniref:GNAT family protein n=1 Tax=Corynebacterium pygosceleis TaxID=2800406 RepID=A0A9Q4C9D2_9CORY|nr:GNAT family protein [Corynebacterium pygosceleis]MCK7638118.1 GNAT family N-acetyltransferase [Corynebacterium pygosceleis]MCK7675832.1 GNAT family N-acetyltransferase [Corynebacterium pygosceleis]MCL0120786.1 GNAT family N-acetyltransferase [Corynebacterium pygosceleis]MCX7444327.1 GNAT family protein [Corynebacterium pygosceleis]MCX7468834.1 GNAT family protein [Corynebacterium pygosceleis]